MTHVLVVGAGLTGLFAAALAGRRGARVTLLTEGRGGLEISHGCIDVLASPLSSVELARLPATHPYQLAGVERIHHALDLFREIVAEQHLEYRGSTDSTLSLPTAAGHTRSTMLAPLAQSAGALGSQEPFHLAALDHFRDFAADYAAARLRRSGMPVDGVVRLPMPNLPLNRDLYSTDLARLFDQPAWRSETLRAWRPRLAGVRRLGLPAVLGLAHSESARLKAEEHLGIRLFEIPTLPPSVPGLRLERALRHAAFAAGVRLIEGAHAVGLVEAAYPGSVSGVVSQTAGGPRPYRADAVILATGGLLHGGLLARARGTVQESVFDLPVAHTSERDDWTADSPFATQPYASFGVRVGGGFRPVDMQARPLFDNLFAAGGLLAGCDRSREGSRQGIDLVSAACAVEEALR